MARIREYHVAYQGNHQEFIKKFEPAHFDEAKLSGFPGISSADVANGMPEMAALALINKWNRQNGTLGFIYWI